MINKLNVCINRNLDLLDFTKETTVYSTYGNDSRYETKNFNSLSEAHRYFAWYDIDKCDIRLNKGRYVINQRIC